MKYTCDNFKEPTMGDNPIMASGRWRYGEINYSSILTKLIQEAGRWCENYASDLFTDWNEVIKVLENGENRSFLFGFRQNGVDNDRCVFGYFEDGGGYSYYRSIYRLDIAVEDDEYATMKLYRVE